jgi:hypothetical protein
MSKSKKKIQHPVNEMLEVALVNVREVRKHLVPLNILTHRDARKLVRVMAQAEKTRDLAVYRARMAGFTVKEVAEMFEISTACVSKICKSHRKSKTAE